MRFAILVLAATLWLSGWAAPARAEILVGFANPLSGPYAASGARNLLAVSAAIDDVNARGGLLGEELRLVVADDACGIESAMEAAGELVTAGVRIVVGHFCSHSSIVAAAVYDMADVIMITPDSTHPRLTEEERPNVFRLIGRDDEQGESAAALIAERWPDRRIGVAHDESTYGRSLARETLRALTERQVDVALVEPYRAKKADYEELVQRLGESDVELLYIAGYGPDAGRIAAAARDAGLGLQVMGGDGLGMPGFWTKADIAGEETVFTTWRLPPPPLAEGDEARRRDAIRLHFRAGGMGAYAAVELWAEAAARAGSLDVASVARVLRRAQFETTAGLVAFDRRGDLVGDRWAWQVWRDGAPVAFE